MKRKLLSFVLSAAMVLSLIPPTKVSAAGTAGVPDDFMKEVTLPLMPAADGELYDEVEGGLPDPSESGFIAEVEGGEPAMPSDGLMAEVGEAPAGAVEIATAEQLQAMTKGTYVLTADIDLTGVAWTPINLTASKSHVVLDGQGHTIKGLTVDATTEANYGLFSYVYGNVTVQNLRMDDVTLNLAVTEESSTSKYGVGALFGSVKGTVKLDNVAAEVEIKRTGAYICKIGGLVGMSSDAATVSDVAVRISMPKAVSGLVGIAHYPAIGGIAGELAGACSFTRCYAAVNLSTTNWGYNAPYGMGGMVGYIGGGHKVTSFTDCMVEGTLVSEDHRAGGLVGGTAGGLTLKNCAVEANVEGREVGGYCAYLQNYNTTSSCVDCRYTGVLTLNTIRDSYGGGFFGQGIAKMTNCAAYILIDAVKATSKVCYLGGFMGDGGGTINRCALDVMMGDFSGTKLFLGGIVGDGTSTITDAQVKFDAVEIKNTAGETSIGGLVGGDSSTTLKAQNCGATVFINFAVPGKAANLYMGGLLGRGGGSMVKCWADGNIYLNNPGDTATHYYLGGLAGTGGTMSQCWAGVDISCAYCPNGTSWCGYVGGLAGEGSSMYSCWSDAKISADGKTVNECVGGLCGYSNGSTYRDCTFTGTIEGVKATELGGILGSCQTGYFYNCYVDNDIEGGKRTGGLLGQASHATTFADCKFEGNVTALEEGGAGGLISAADDVLNGTATLRRCEVKADITCPGGNAYGMAGPTKAYDCEFHGELSGGDMGGIGESGSFYDCTATVWFEADQRETDSNEIMNVGGISSGSAAVASNCRVTNHLYLTVYMDENENSLQIRFGGIGGVVSKAVDCKTMGVSLSCYGDDSSVDEDKEDDRFSIHVGGIAGEMGKGMDNCRVSGSVSAHATLGSIYVGGLAGKDTSGINGSSTTGCVASGGSGTVKKSTAYAGGLFGSGTDKTLISGCVTGGGYAACWDNENGAHSGKWTGNDKYDIGSKTLDIPARPNENYTILTFEYPDAAETAALTITPLAGVTITAGKENLGKTNSAGMLTINRDQVDSTDMKITGSKDGYFSDDSGVTLAGGGSTSLYLMKKTDGKIYLTSALYTDTNPLTGTKKTVDLLTDPNTVSILQSDQEAQDVSFGVDWNGAKTAGRVLQLNNEAETKPLDILTSEGKKIKVQNHFDPEEDIYIIAKAYFGNSEEPYKVKLKLNLKVEALELKGKVETDSVPYGPTEEKPGLDFLNGVFVTATFGDMVQWAPKVEVKNGTATIDFGSLAETRIELGKGLLNGKTKISLGGKLQLDMGEMDTPDYKWAGELRGSVMLDPLMDHSKPFAVVGIPCAINSTIKVGGSFGGGFEGTHNSGTFYGRIGAEGEVDILAGPGVSTKEIKFLAGPDLGATGTMDYYQKHTDHADGWAATLTGAISLKVKLECGDFIEFEPGFQVGSFKWDETNGAKFYLLGEEFPAAVNLNNVYWVPDSQSYLSAGGGFHGGTLSDTAALNAWSGGTSGVEQTIESVRLYENVFESSEQAMAVENGTAVLYFTADDGERELTGRVQDHAALWRTELSEEGTWSAPEKLTDSGYPDDLDADGPFAVWVESDQTGDLAGLLTSSDVMVRVNGETVQLTEGTGYVYGAAVSASADGSKALVTWLSDPAVDGVEQIISGEGAQLCYAAYDGAAWKTGVVNTGSRTAVTATPDQIEERIYWQTADGTVYTSTGSTFASVTKKLAEVGCAAHEGLYTAAVTGNYVTVWNDVEEVAVLDTGAVSDLTLRRDADGVYYLIWSSFDGVWYADSASGWANIKQITQEEQAVRDQCAVVINGLPLVSYYRSKYTDTGTELIYDLYTAKAKDLSGVDLALTEVEIDTLELAQHDVLYLRAKAVNMQESEISSFTYRVTDELGNELSSGTVDDRTLGYGETREFQALVAADCTAVHTYTVTVTADGDENAENDFASVTAESAVEVVNTEFIRVPNGTVELNAVVGSIGAAPVEHMSVEIYRCASDGSVVGDALASQSFENVPAGSYRQVILPEAVSHQRYQVVVTTPDGKTDNQMLMWKDETASGVWVSGVSVDEDAGATVKLIAQNWTQDIQLHLALYQDGRMVTNAMKALKAWDGSQTVKLDLDELPEGEYTYAVYLLKQSDLSPVAAKYSDAVN